MKNLFTLCITLFSIQFISAQTSGGPDAYGYTWRDSNDPNGPSFDWVDITTSGTLVTGLTDDNATAFISMDGMSFHYYWNDITKLIIGSNGWIGFSLASNIAHCFPTMPTAGGSADHFLAPMMTDLLISQPGFNADVYYYYDQPNDRYIVSYVGAPWWNVNAPGYLGSNTFQVILSAQDSSITYQYLDVDQVNLNNQVGCDQDLIIGIENLTGGIGLQVYQEVVPADNYAIKFYYPNPVTYSIQDAGPNWNQNIDNKGQFVLAQSDFNLQTGISNFGNADITSEILVNGRLNDLNNITVYTGVDTIPNLSAGGANTVVFSDPANLSPGQYFYQTETVNADDVNLGNNISNTEINSVDMTQGNFMLSYATQAIALTSVLWQGGDGGAGVYLKPPSYPVTLESVAVYMVDAGGPQNFQIEIYDDNLGSSIPGTSLATEFVSGTSFTTNAWVNVPLSNPIEITSGGIFVGWIHEINSTIGLGSEQVGPISRQSFEYIGGNWAVYRENNNTELLINGVFSTECGSLTVNTESIEHTSCFGSLDGAINVTVTGGTDPYTYNWDNALGAIEDPNGIGSGVYVLTVTDSAGCTTGTSVTLNQPADITGSEIISSATQGNNGAIDFTPAGGTPPYSFLWSTGFATEDITGLTVGPYSLTVIDAEGCTATFDFIVTDQVGISEYRLVKIDVYPNPNTGSFVVAGDFTDDGFFELTDITGRQIRFEANLKANRADIRLTESSTGVYLLRWITNEAIGTVRLSVTK